MIDVINVALERIAPSRSGRTLTWAVENGAHARGYAEVCVHSAPHGLDIVAAHRQLDALAHDEHVRSCANQPAPEPWQQCSDVMYHGHLISDTAETIEVLRVHPGTALCVSLTLARVFVIALRWRECIHVLDGDAGHAYSPAMCAPIGSVLHASLAAGFHPGALTALSVEDLPPFALSRPRIAQTPSRES